MDDRKSWGIKDEAVLSDLVTLMDLTAAEKTILAAVKDQAQAAAPQLVDAFYSRLLAHAPTAEYLDGKIEHLRVKLQEWFAQIFAGNYDSDYVKSRMLIGQIHVRIGLPVRYPLAMMDLLIQHGEQITRQSTQPDQALSAFHKLLALDIAVFNQAYEDTQLKHLAELLGNERLARRLLTQ